jgi:hypothetical protein
MITLAGPQRLKPTLGPALGAVAGRVATITAGWQEREADDQDLDAACGGRSVNLRLHARGETIFAADEELKEAHRLRQERLMQLQGFYQIRLDGLTEAAQAVARRTGDAATRAEEQQISLEAVRALDRQHLARVAEVYAEFETTWKPAGREAVARQRGEVAAALADCAALAVAGGHVAVLLNRLKLFDIVALRGARPVLAWSAGAMALSDTVVLFHDSPPQGAGIPQVFDTGLGLVPGIVPLPSPRLRLRLDDRERVALLARRFAPAACVAFDDGAQVSFAGGRFTAAQGTQRLDVSGRVDGSWAVRSP